MRLTRLVVALFLSAGAICGQQTNPKDSAAVEFDQLKSLAGDWEATATEGGKEMSATVTFRLASGGSVLVSDLAPGTPHEMITMFHRDREDLLATHYCMTGNQPRMRAVATPDPSAVSFVFKDATNLPDPGVPHMEGVKFTFLDANHHLEEWTVVAGGKSSIRKFDCKRKT
jgi:hypothetical protein